MKFDDATAVALPQNDGIASDLRLASRRYIQDGIRSRKHFAEQEVVQLLIPELCRTQHGVRGIARYRYD